MSACFSSPLDFQVPQENISVWVMTMCPGIKHLLSYLLNGEVHVYNELRHLLPVLFVEAWLPSFWAYVMMLLKIVFSNCLEETHILYLIKLHYFVCSYHFIKQEGEPSLGFHIMQPNYKHRVRPLY